MSKFLRTFTNFYRSCLGKQTIPEPSPERDAPTLNALPKLFFLSNWRVDNRELPRFQILGAGELIEPLAHSLVKAISQKLSDSRIGWSWDADNREAQSRPLRVIDRDAPGHLVATDIHLFQKNGDLFIGYSGKAWSKSRFWTRLFGFIILPTVLIAVMAWVVTQPGFRKSWVRDFAKKHADTGSVTYSSSGAGGQSTSQSFTSVEPLENFIENGSQPTGEWALGTMIQMILNHPDYLPYYEKLAMGRLDKAEKRFGSFGGAEDQKLVADFFADGTNKFTYGSLEDLGIFPVAGGAPSQFAIAKCGFSQVNPYTFEGEILAYLSVQDFFNFAPRHNSPVSIKPSDMDVGMQQIALDDYNRAVRLRQSEKDSQERMNQSGGYGGYIPPSMGIHSYVPPRPFPENSAYEHLLNQRRRSHWSDGLSEEENNLYFDAKLNLEEFFKTSSMAEAQLTFKRDKKIQEALMIWLKLGNKTRIEGVANVRNTIVTYKDNPQTYYRHVLALYLILVHLDQAYDELTHTLPAPLQNEFSKIKDSQIHYRWSALKLFSKDWLLFLAGPAKVPALIFAGLMALTLFLPKSGLRALCSLVRWPSPQTFDNAISAQNTGIQGLVSMLLRKEFRISEERIIKVSR